MRGTQRDRLYTFRLFFLTFLTKAKVQSIALVNQTEKAVSYLFLQLPVVASLPINKKGNQKIKGDVFKHRPFMLNSLNKSRPN